MERVAGATLAGVLLLAAVFLTGACSKPAPDPPAKAIPAKVVEGTTLTADPNPILSDGSGLGETTIAWSTKASHVDLRIGGPGGKLFGGGGSTGTARSGKWVNDGMTFYLQNKDAAEPTSADATLGAITVAVQ